MDAGIALEMHVRAVWPKVRREKTTGLDITYSGRPLPYPPWLRHLPGSR
ncbi:MAG: hypothetical protein WDZ63_12665 [Burkholderiales bacterium]